MNQEKQIIAYLQNITADVGIIAQKLDAVDKKIDRVEESLNQRIDRVEESLNQRIDAVEEKVDALRKDMDERFEMVEKALDSEIDKVYQVALENKRNIEIFLIPFNDRNHYMNEEVAKIKEVEERIDAVEKVVGEHSELIRKLQTA